MRKSYRFKVEKMIRDKLPQIMQSYGITVYDRVLSQQELVLHLKDKLREEIEVIIALRPQKRSWMNLLM